MSTDNQQAKSIAVSAGKVSGATALSRILGLVREQVMAIYFGAGMATDAFVAAFRIPNLLRDMFAEGALSSAFVPVFKKQLVDGSKEEAFNLARVVLTAILAFVGLIVLVGIIIAPLIVYVMANGFTEEPEKFALTVSLTRVMFAYLLLVAVSAMIMGMLNSVGRFGIPALSPCLFNLGVIGTVVALYSYLETPVYALAIGVLVGGVGQVALQLPSLWKIGFRFRPRFDFLDEGLKKVVSLMTPMIVGMSAGRINILVSTLVASYLMEGAITYLYYAYRLMHFPLGVFAVAIGTVALPKLSELVARNDSGELNKTFAQTINLNLLLVVPSAFFLMIMSGPIIDLIYHWGAFSQQDANNTGMALIHYAYGLIGFSVVRVTAPFFYAFNDSKLPMKVSLMTVFLNIALYYPMVTSLGFVGLAAATSLAGLFNATVLVLMLPRMGIEPRWSSLILTWVRITLAAGLACYFARTVPDLITVGDSELVLRVLKVFLTLIVAVVSYVILCLLFRVREISDLWGSLRSFRIKKSS